MDAAYTQTFTVIEKKRKVCKIIGITVPHDYQIAD